MATETTEEITKDLESREQGRYMVNLLDFIKIEDILYHTKSRFTYDARAGTFRFISPTPIHFGGYHWFYGWVRDMECRRMIGTEYIEVLGNVDLRGFEGEFTGSKKNASCGLYFGLRIWPTIALELGYGENDDELLNDTNLLLEGSKGNIGFVILVKIERLDSDNHDGQIKAGYVELHKYSNDTGKGVRVGDRKCLYPVPADHAEQYVEFSWDDILREQPNLRATQEEPLPLYLDDLRAILDKEAKQLLGMDPSVENQ